MVGTFRQRRVVSALLLGALALGLAACGGVYPNSTFNHHTEFNTSIDALWNTLLAWGTGVFIAVEIALVYTIFRFRRRPGGKTPEQVHGNTVLEIAWTAIPAVILIFIAIPTVRTIFKTQAKAAPNALQVQVIGHQWWWEFRYPEYGITTANELYLPTGRTVNFELKTQDVLHAFWIPQMGGKRDLISNKSNYLWFTPNADLPSSAWNGFCAEYCGSSHANMKFRVYTVTPDEFAKWTAHQQQPAAAAPAPAAPAVAKTAAQTAAKPADSAAQAVVAPVQVPVWTFPQERLDAEFAATKPTMPIPPGMAFDENLLSAGDVDRGRQIYSRSACIGCHVVKGNPMSMGVIGPNLTHVATRHTLAGGLYVNDQKHLAYWIKNAPHRKPGSIMPTIGKGLYDPVRKNTITIGGLTDAEIADVVAYLQSLK
ncbi:MAG: cytochrome c oxidase subunit II [Gemmatimonadaceae bacterium]|nr:cytochrome c oxidase subunit II [Gemmatimonadaceae bacterium]